MIKSIANEEVAGSTDAAQLPAVPYSWGYIKAARANTGNVYIGGSSDVAIVGTTDAAAKTGFELDAGEVLPLEGVGNLNDLWYICDNATDTFVYLVAVTQ